MRRVVLLCVLPMAVLVSGLIYASYQQAREDAKGVVLREAAQVANDVSMFLDQTERALNRIARRPGVAKLDPGQCDPSLKDLIAIQPRYLNILTIERTGRLVCSSTFPSDGTREIKIPEGTAFQGAMTGKPFTLGAVRKGLGSEQWVAAAAVPLRDASGNPVGALVVVIHLAAWWPPGSLDTLPPNAILGAFEKTGRVALRTPEPEKWIGREPTERLSVAIRTGEESFIAPGARGFDRVWAVKPIPRTEWVAFAALTSESVFATACRNALVALALMLAALCASTWAAVRASRRITLPIADLASVAARVGAGASERALSSGPSEIASVAKEFNRMLEIRDASEARFRDFALASADWYWETDAESRYTWVSNALEAGGERSPSALLGRNLTEIALEDGIDLSAEPWRSHLEARARHEQFRNFVYKTGTAEEVWLSMSGVPRFDRDGRFLGYRGITSDITSRVMQERGIRAALRATDLRYHHILSHLHTAILLVGEDGRVEFCNREFLSMFGLDMTPEDLLGKSAFETLALSAVSYRDPEAGRARVEAIVADGKPVRRELVGLKGDRFVLRDFAPLAVGGRKLGRLWNHHDISELTRAQSSLAERTRHLQIILDAMPGPVVHLDIQRRYTFANRPFCEFFGLQLEDVIGRTAGAIMGDRTFQIVQSHTASAWQGESVTYEREHVMPDGSKRDMVVHALPEFNELGELQGIICLTLDVTEQRTAERAAASSEARFMDVIDSVDGIFWEADARTLTISKVSKNAERLLGYPVEEWLAPGFWASHLHAEDRDSAMALTAMHTEADRNHDIEYRFIAADGRIVWLRDQVTVVSQEGGASLLRGLMTDISARKRAESERASLEAQLRESQKMAAVGTLAGGIAHDFNNILATILGNIELARQDAGNDPDLAESLEEIRRAATRGRDVVQQILAFSRRQPTARKIFAPGPVVEATARLLRTTLPPRVTLHTQCPPDVPEILGDPTQLQQVVLNLVANAVQAMQEAAGSIVLNLDAVKLDAGFAELHPAVLPLLKEGQAGTAVRLAVSDDGPGIEGEVIARIFEPFFTTKPMGEATGLGLSVVHGIVQAHDGVIDVSSTPGQGATFTLYLPAARESREPVAAGPAAAPVPATNGNRILYVDDDESLVFLVKRLLGRRGYVVAGFTRQQAALDALRAAPQAFDLLVTDYNMPGLSGLDVAREALSIRADLPVAVSSGFIDEALNAQAKAAGVREVIFKAMEVEDYCVILQGLAAKAAAA